MKSLRILTAILATVGIASAASATTLQGTLSYDSGPIASTFPGFGHGLAAAVNTETQEWVYGTTDPVTGSYSIADLTSGPWFVRVLFGAEEIDEVMPHSDEVLGYDYVTVAGEPTLSLRVLLSNRDGVSLGSMTISLEPFATTQINDLGGQVAGLSRLAEGQVTVTVTAGSGKVSAVLSVIDSTSQDPTTIALQPQ